MNSDLCVLVTLYQVFEGGGSLLRCALKIPDGRNRFESKYLMEDAEKIRALLPMHVASIGPICAIEEIFEVAGV